jgi:hypothetical protein
MIEEEWRPVAGHEELYEVSNHGRVRSLARTVRWKTRWGSYGTRSNPPMLRKLTVDSHGYLRVSMKRYGTGSNPLVHQLVATAFLGERPEWATQVNHLDKDKTNNHVSNLEWSCPKPNNRHAHAQYLWEGRLMCLTELSEIAGLGVTTLHWRLSNGWDLETAMSKRQWERNRWTVEAG